MLAKKKQGARQDGGQHSKQEVNKELEEATLSQYDVLAIPLSAIDVENPGELFKTLATGPRDLKARKRWAGLLAAGYKVHSFSINNNTMYILFHL